MSGRAGYHFYDHHVFVSLVHLVCPKCHKRAKATLITETGEPYLGFGFSEFSFHDFKSWKVACESCVFRLEIPFPKKIHKEKTGIGISCSDPYSVLGDFYYRIESMGFWAYNFDHLKAIVKYLEEGKLQKDDPFYWVVTPFMRRDWLRAKKKLLNLIQKKYSI